MAALLNLEDLQLIAGKHTILQHVNLRINEGEKIALIGPSGAGKTTLLHHIYKLLRENCALCPQQLGLVDTLSLYHNIYMGQLSNHSLLKNTWNLFFPLKKSWTAAETLSNTLQLTPALTTSVARLSGGEQQRVAIARALFSDKAIFIGDEPIANLDPKLQNDVLRIILKHHSTVIIALHDPILAHTKFDRLIGMRSGQIIFDAASSSLSLEQLQQFYLEYHE